MGKELGKTQGPLYDAPCTPACQEAMGAGREVVGSGDPLTILHHRGGLDQAMVLNCNAKLQKQAWGLSAE